MRDAPAVSRAVTVAVREYYRAAGRTQESELLGRLFEQWLGHFRRLAWGCDTGAELLTTVKAVIPVDEAGLREVLE